MIRLAEGVYSWNIFNEEKGLHFNGFLVSCRDGLVVIDPPPHAGDLEKFLDKKLRAEPILAVVTNKHHLRDVLWWIERYDIPLAMHEAETNDYDFDVSRKLKEGETIAGELEVLNLPGKTPGEIGLHLARDGGAVFLGDAIIGDPPGALRLLPKEKLQSQQRLEESLQKLRALSFERLFLGDGEPLLSGAKPLVMKFLDSLRKPVLAS
jgi:glyoxylase-like metal-dependent hydrolase (beta-lactamase superfamily II)